MNQSSHHKLNSSQGDRYNQFSQLSDITFNSIGCKLSNYCFQGLLSLGIVLIASATPAMGQTVTISGRVFEDFNYGGGPGRNFATAEASAINSEFPVLGDTYATGLFRAEVELYSYDGIDFNNSQLIQLVTTDDDGYYLFDRDIENELLRSGHYLIRVLNKSIISNREINDTNEVPIAVQTFRNDPDETTTEIIDEVGGANPAIEDEYGSNFGSPIPVEAQSVTAVDAFGDVSNVDFGFNFDTIVNTNSSGQGSLAQFVLNSKELANDNLAQDLPTEITAPTNSNGIAVNLSDYETSIFMIPDPNLDNRVTSGTAFGQINLSNSPPDDGSGSAFVIDISDSSQPLEIVDLYTSIDGRTQTVNVPSVRNMPNIPDREPDEEWTKIDFDGYETTGPEIIISRDTGDEDIFQAKLGNIIFHSIGIISKDSEDSRGLIISGNGTDSIQLGSIDNVIMEELTVATSNCGIEGVAMVESVIRKSVIKDSGLVGRCNNIQLRRNSNFNLIEDNWILRSSHYGIQLTATGNNDNIIRDNIVFGNGTGGDSANGQTAGIGLIRSTNTNIIDNTIIYNEGDGITITNDSQNNIGNIISRNIIYNNGDLGIDLGRGRSNRGGAAGDGVSDNDTRDGDSGGNGLQNFPEIYLVIDEDTDKITIKGVLESTPNTNFRIEIFTNDVCNTDRNVNEQAALHGEGQNFLIAIDTTTDGDGVANFSSTPIARSTLRNGSSLTKGNIITATATNTSTNNTSEFSQCTIPNLLLVKRITAINPGQPDERLFTDSVNDEKNMDDDLIWEEVRSEDGNSYIVGAINVGEVKPEDEVEYTIYFLSNGSEPAQNVLICDLIPEHMELVPNSFSSEPPADDGLPGAARGILWQYGQYDPPDRAAQSLTNANDGDDGYYFPPGVDPSTVFPDRPNPPNPPTKVCGSETSSNTNGAVVINLNDLPVAKVPEDDPASDIPSDSYGFIRFRAKVK